MYAQLHSLTLVDSWGNIGWTEEVHHNYHPGSIRMHGDHDEIMNGNASFNPNQLNMFFSRDSDLTTSPRDKDMIC